MKIPTDASTRHFGGSHVDSAVRKFQFRSIIDSAAIIAMFTYARVFVYFANNSFQFASETTGNASSGAKSGPIHKFCHPERISPVAEMIQGSAALELTSCGKCTKKRLISKNGDVRGIFSVKSFDLGVFVEGSVFYRGSARVTFRFGWWNSQRAVSSAVGFERLPLVESRHTENG